MQLLMCLACKAADFTPATAVIAREIMMMIYRWAWARGSKGENLAEGIPPTSIARFKARDRSLGPASSVCFTPIWIVLAPAR